ncbi:hypothetical protein RRG08_013822 [Elysia crispata]|uniref:Uncharacterized protein n=1 Tax=Elysia crispata TaxID=231223 RepID=A0AAE1BC28_9GAST|nr:hypothetical protein RRG08_013822 [Elysia crispata]
MWARKYRHPESLSEEPSGQSMVKTESKNASRSKIDAIVKDSDLNDLRSDRSTWGSTSSSLLNVKDSDLSDRRRGISSWGSKSSIQCQG